MTFPTDQLAAAEAEIDAAYRSSRKDFIFAFIPALMSLLATLSLRKKRAELRALMATPPPPPPAEAVVDVEARDIDAEACFED